MVYYQALTGRTLYRIDAATLRDPALDDQARAAAVETVASSGPVRRPAVGRGGRHFHLGDRGRCGQTLESRGWRPDGHHRSDDRLARQLCRRSRRCAVRDDLADPPGAESTRPLPGSSGHGCDSKSGVGGRENRRGRGAGGVDPSDGPQKNADNRRTTPKEVACRDCWRVKKHLM